MTRSVSRCLPIFAKSASLFTFNLGKINNWNFETILSFQKSETSKLVIGVVNLARALHVFISIDSKTSCLFNKTRLDISYYYSIFFSSRFNSVVQFNLRRISFKNRNFTNRALAFANLKRDLHFPARPAESFAIWNRNSFCCHYHVTPLLKSSLINKWAFSKTLYVLLTFIAESKTSFSLMGMVLIESKGIKWDLSFNICTFVLRNEECNQQLLLLFTFPIFCLLLPLCLIQWIYVGYLICVGS